MRTAKSRNRTGGGSTYRAAAAETAVVTEIQRRGRWAAVPSPDCGVDVVFANRRDEIKTAQVKLAAATNGKYRGRASGQQPSGDAAPHHPRSVNGRWAYILSPADYFVFVYLNEDLFCRPQFWITPRTAIGDRLSVYMDPAWREDWATLLGAA